MIGERAFIEALRAIAPHEGARGLTDDAALLEVGGTTLVLTCDMIVEGVHYLAHDPPADVAWKLVAVNLSDLAGKGARPAAALLAYALGDAEWDRAFAEGLGTVLGAFGLPLLGGDTVAMPKGAPRALSLTAIGTAAGPVPHRGGAGEGDHLWVSGTIGDAGAGLAAIRAGEATAWPFLVERYRNPRPRLEAGERLAPSVSAMMDVSDGLLIDARRMAEASGLETVIELDVIPLSAAYVEARGEARDARLAAATAGDDYELLFAAPASKSTEILHLGEEMGMSFTRIGRFAPGTGLAVLDRGENVELPGRLGFEHRAPEPPRL